MSLIQCPECGRSVSDKSIQCIHCGYPIREMMADEKLYSISIIDILGKGWEEKGMHRRGIAMVLEERYHIPNRRSMFDSSLARELEDLPKVILTGIPGSLLEIIKRDLESMWCVIKIEEFDGERNTTDFSGVIDRVSTLPDTLRCPKCSSNMISTSARGYSLLTGFLGSNKTVNRCGNCGYTWKP